VGAGQELGAVFSSIKHAETRRAGKEGFVEVFIIDGDCLDQGAANRVSIFLPVMVQEIFHGAHDVSVCASHCLISSLWSSVEWA